MIIRNVFRSLLSFSKCCTIAFWTFTLFSQFSHGQGCSGGGCGEVLLNVATIDAAANPLPEDPEDLPDAQEIYATFNGYRLENPGEAGGSYHKHFFRRPGLPTPVGREFYISFHSPAGWSEHGGAAIFYFGCRLTEVKINGQSLKITGESPQAEAVINGYEIALSNQGGCTSRLIIGTTNEGPALFNSSFTVEIPGVDCDKTKPPQYSSDGSFGGSMSSGADGQGVAAGTISWESIYPSDAVDLGSWSFAGEEIGLNGVTDHTFGTTRQIKTASRLVSLNRSANTLTVETFDAAGIGMPDGNGLYSTAGLTLLQESTYEMSEERDPVTNAITRSRLQVAVVEGQETVGWNELDYDVVSGRREWTDHLAGTRGAISEGQTSSGQRTETREEYRFSMHEGFVLISKVTKVFEDLTPEGKLIETVVDPDGANLSTTYQYNPSTGNVGVTRSPDGSWVSSSEEGFYEMGGQWFLGLVAADGLPDSNWDSVADTVNSVTYRPWLDSPLPTSGVPDPDTCVAELYIILSSGVQRRETRVMGQTTRRVDAWSEYLQEGGTGPFYNVEFTRTWNSGTAGDYLDSSVWTHTEGDWNGRTYKTVAEDGIVRKFAYAEITYSNAGFTGDCFQTTEWQEGSGLRTVRVVDDDGRSREEREEINTGGSTWEMMTRDTYTYEFDLAGRLLSESSFQNGILVAKTTHVSPTETLEESMGSPAIRTIKDGRGNVLSVTEEAPGRADIVTTYARDGRSETVTRSAGDLSETSVTVSDVAGRIISSTDAQGIVTTTAYDVANRAVTVSRPGGVTDITQTYVDGRQKSRSGTGVIPSFTAYAVDGNGFLSTTEHTGSSDNSSPRTVTTVADWNGRTRTVSRPSPAGSGTVVETSHYDAATGRLVRVSNNAGLAAQVYAYDSLGRITLSGLDLDADGSPTVLSGDRLTGTTVTHEKSNGIWQEVTTTRQYHTNSSTDAYVTVYKRALKPVAAGTKARWTVVTIQPGGAVVTTLRDEHLANCTVEETADLSITTLSPDMKAVSTGGWLLSSSEYGTAAPSTFAYDALGRLTAATDPRGGTTRTAYNEAGQVTHTSDHAQNSTMYHYWPVNHQNAGQLKKVTNGEGETTEYAYDTLGRITVVGGTGTYPQAYGYNAYGEMNSLTTYPAGSSGETTTWLWDGASGVLEEKGYPGGNKTLYAYHAHGKPSKRTWARASGTVFTDYSYTLAGDLKKTDYSDTTPDVTLFPDGHSPDRLGRPTKIIDGGGEQTIAYDPAMPGEDEIVHSATHAVLPGVTIDRIWSGGRRLSSEVRSGGFVDQITVISYDGETGLPRYIGPDGWSPVSHEYEYAPGTSLITGIKHYFDSQVVATETRRIDPAGRLYAVETVGGAGTVLQRHGYKHDRAGRRTKLTREDGAYWDYVYNDRGEVISGKKKLLGGTPLAGHQFEYAYDAIGNRDWAKSGGDTDGQNLRTTDYTANGLNQYTQITTPGKFDILGRSPAATVTVNGTAALRQGERFRSEVTAINVGSAVWKAVTVDDGTSPAVTGNYYLPKLSVQPQYDDDGNLTADGRWLYEWDTENRLVVMKTDTATQQSGQPYVRLVFSYDWRGRRVRKQVFNTPTGTTPVEDRRFAYDGWNLVAEYTASGSSLTLQRSYSWGLDLSGTEQGAGGVGGLLNVHHGNGSLAGIPAYDGNGNITGWLDSSGAMLSQMEYDPFGNRIVSEGSFESSFGFSTKYQDKETGLYYYGYRYYQPKDGRWINRDPIKEEGGDNIYAFLLNNGNYGWDYLGLSPARAHPSAAAEYFRILAAAERTMRASITHRMPGSSPNMIGALGRIRDAAKHLSDIYYDDKFLASIGATAAYLGGDFHNIVLSKHATVNDVIHEGTHAVFRDWGGKELGESRAYAMENLYVIHKKADEFYGYMVREESKHGDNCAEVRRWLRINWYNITDLLAAEKYLMNYNWLPGYEWSEKSRPMTSIDFAHAQALEGAQFNCERLARFLNKQSFAKGCCVTFSCDYELIKSDPNNYDEDFIIYSSRPISWIFR